MSCHFTSIAKALISTRPRGWRSAICVTIRAILYAHFKPEFISQLLCEPNSCVRIYALLLINPLSSQNHESPPTTSRIHLSPIGNSLLCCTLNSFLLTRSFQEGEIASHYFFHAEIVNDPPKNTHPLEPHYNVKVSKTLGHPFCASALSTANGFFGEALQLISPTLTLIIFKFTIQSKRLKDNLIPVWIHRFIDQSKRNSAAHDQIVSTWQPGASGTRQPH